MTELDKILMAKLGRMDVRVGDIEHTFKEILSRLEELEKRGTNNSNPSKEENE